jgi:hypothetical protein
MEWKRGCLRSLLDAGQMVAIKFEINPSKKLRFEEGFG